MDPPFFPGDESEKVLEIMKVDGTLGALQQEALERLKDDVRAASPLCLHSAPAPPLAGCLTPTPFLPLALQPEFLKHVQRLVSSSDALKHHSGGSQLLASLKKELEAEVVSDAALRLFQILSSPDKGFSPKLDACVLLALNKTLTCGQLEQPPPQK